MGCHFILQGFFLTQVSNPSLLHWQEDSLPLSHQGSPANSGMHIRESYAIYFIKIINCSMMLENNILPSSTGHRNYHWQSFLFSPATFLIPPVNGSLLRFVDAQPESMGFWIERNPRVGLQGCLPTYQGSQGHSWQTERNSVLFELR